MKHIFIINGGQQFAHSGGQFNRTLTSWTEEFFGQHSGFEVKTTDINDAFDLPGEVAKFVWADTVIYHTPVWWFQLPNRFKRYIDEVFTEGHRTGIYNSDGRSRTNPDINYGTGGQLHGRNYLLTTSWNAPEAAFTMPGEFFGQTAVDDGPMFGFHRMNAFTGMQRLNGFHFFDMEKNVTPEGIQRYKEQYLQHLEEVFLTEGLPETTESIRDSRMANGPEK